jgi:hypothetical protein
MNELTKQVTDIALATPGMTPEEKKQAEALGSSGGYLPYINIVAGSSPLQKKIPVGNFALVTGKEENVPVGIDLGVRFEGFVLAFRSHARDNMAGVSSYDFNSATFKDIAARSKDRDSECMAGPQYLIYIVGHGWCTYWACSWSSNFQPYCKKALTDILSTGTYKFEATLRTESNKAKQFYKVPAFAPLTGPLPEIEDMAEQIAAFKNPAPPAIEKAPDQSETKRPR